MKTVTDTVTALISGQIFSVSDVTAIDEATWSVAIEQD